MSEQLTHAPTAVRRRSRLARRYRNDVVLRGLGLSAILVAMLLLAILFASLIGTGWQAFLQTHVEVEVFVDPDRVDAENPQDANYKAILDDAFLAYFPDVTGRRERRDVTAILSPGARYILRDTIVGDPQLIGQTIAVKLPASDPVDQLAKGTISRDVPEQQRRVSDRQIAWFDRLQERDLISRPFNWQLFLSADSRHPEIAGLAGAIAGSFYALLVCFVLSFPLGIAAAIWLEEFAPRNRWTNLVEVNINNLAAVPSIVFGLLGLAVLLNFLGMPRSAPLVGGMVLALMTMPTIIIATRAALTAVSPSVREAAYGVGASKHQVILHHVLPLAMPGILTGTIIGLAQALGETAPLLLIGMNAFITSAPEGILQPSTALPTQIFIWADSPERGFVAKTSAAILVLLGFLVLMNGAAVYLRRRFERKW